MSITRNVFWSLSISAILLAAVFYIGFQATQIYLSEAPWVEAEKRIKSLAQGGNAIAHNVHLPSAFQEGAVRLSACAFDLRSGGVLLAMPDTSLAWVVAAYSRSGENFFSLASASADARPAEQILLKSSRFPQPPEIGKARVAKAPRDQGLVLFRLFEDAGADEKAIAMAQESMACRPAPQSPKTPPNTAG